MSATLWAIGWGMTTAVGSVIQGVVPPYLKSNSVLEVDEALFSVTANKCYAQAAFQSNTFKQLGEYYT